MARQAPRARPAPVMKAMASVLIALCLLCAAAPGAAAQQRVRKELRSLSDKEYRALILGLSVMNLVSTEAGRRLFGPQYISYMEMMMKHAVAVNDPRGDQGHAGPCFMTFHRAWLLELENSLLAIAPDLKALPYWDVTLDSREGKYWGTEKYIFSDRYAGYLDGNSTVNYGVTSGVFAWRQVQHMVPQQFPQWASYFSGNPEDYYRSASNLNNLTLVTRYPTSNLMGSVDANNTGKSISLIFAKHNVTVPWESLYEVRGKYGLNYPPRNFDRCLNPKNYTSWMDWSYCLDITTIFTAPNGTLTDQFIQKYLGPEAGTTSLLHAGMHWGVGSMANQSGEALGDAFDVATSPNEMLLFFSHHANIDRSSLTWMTRAAKGNKTMEAAYWQYPATTAQYSTAVPGCLLGDVVSSNAGFKTLFKTPPQNATGYTHMEVISLASPLNPKTPYTYDTLKRGAGRR